MPRSKFAMVMQTTAFHTIRRVQIMAKAVPLSPTTRILLWFSKEPLPLHSDHVIKMKPCYLHGSRKYTVYAMRIRSLDSMDER